MTARIRPAASAMTLEAVTAAGATHLAVDLVGGGFAALLPTIAERLSLSSTGAGTLVVLFSVSAFASQPLWVVWLIDSMGDTSPRSQPLAAAAVVTSALVLVTLIIVGGLASAAFHPAGVMLARRRSPASPENAVAIFAAAGTVGLAAGPIAALALADDAARSRVWLLAVPALLVVPVMWRRSRALAPVGVGLEMHDMPSESCCTARSQSWELRPLWSLSQVPRSLRPCPDGSPMRSPFL